MNHFWTWEGTIEDILALLHERRSKRKRCDVTILLRWDKETGLELKPDVRLRVHEL